MHRIVRGIFQVKPIATPTYVAIAFQRDGTPRSPHLELARQPSYTSPGLIGEASCCLLSWHAAAEISTGKKIVVESRTAQRTL
jgi:hypothetical protein